MIKLTFVLLGFVFFACAEKLIEEPENLIPKEKMVEILNDLAIVNAAKITNVQVLRTNNIEPMEYIFTKYGIDSLQFVESDRYYASIPKEHEEIYTLVVAKLEKEKERLSEEKKVRDSLKIVDKEEARRKIKLKDSLRQIDDKKKEL